MATAFCPDCDEEITLDRKPKIGQRVTCPNCEIALEVIETEPLELDWAYDGPEGEDDEEW